MNGGSGSSELKIQENTETKVGCMEEFADPSNAIEGYVPKSAIAHLHLQFPKIKEKVKISKGIDLTNGTDFASTINIIDEPSTSEIEKTVSCTPSRGSKGNVTSCENAVKASKELYAAETDQASETKLRSSLKSSGVKKINHSVTWADKNDNVGHKNLCEIRELEDAKEGTYGSDGDDVEDENSVIEFASAEACAAALSQAAEAVASGQSDVIDAVSEAGVIILPHPHDVNNGDPEVDVDTFKRETEPAPLKWPRKHGLTNLDVFDPENSWYNSPPEGFTLDLSTFATMWMALFAWITSSSLANIYGQDESFHEDYLAVNGREYPRKISVSDGCSSEIEQTIAGCLAWALPEVIEELRLPTPISTLEKGMLLLQFALFYPLSEEEYYFHPQWQHPKSVQLQSTQERVCGYRGGICLFSIIVVKPSKPTSGRPNHYRCAHNLGLDLICWGRTGGGGWLMMVRMNLGGLLVMMSFVDPLPSFRFKQWQILDDAKVTMDEYKLMKDLIIPLGRVPHFSPQNGAWGSESVTLICRQMQKISYKSSHTSMICPCNLGWSPHALSKKN
ncbi:hypothetical protein RJ641_020831 [Dillenia turbinata]|uniref:Uncharacterized protein n=1 Tax=Dillenia turbinata TaxID=194707 RepID=A0AAN8UKH4_9MAGN